MTSREAVREQLLGPEQVGQVGPREAPAEQARTVVLDRLRVVEEAPVAEVQPTARDPQLPVPGDPGRQHAVEQVDPAMDGLEQVRRRAEAHQVARPRVVRQQRDGDVERRVALLGRLVAGQAADAQAVERQPGDEPGRRLAQLRVEAALDDPEQRLVRPRVGRAATARPSGASARSRRPRPLAASDGIDRLVEGDGDVRAERLLDGDGDAPA